MLTSRQAEVLKFIREYAASRGTTPTLREIATALGLSSLSTVHKHLESLKDKGYIERQSNAQRSCVPFGTCPTCGQAVAVADVQAPATP